VDLAKPNKIKAYARLTTLDEMKQCLFQNGPFIITVSVSNKWFSVGPDGIIEPGGSNIGYHGIAFVGYDDVTRLVKIKNSWGTGWGQEGYGYIDYDVFMYILTDAWSSVDIPEGEEERYTLPAPKNWLNRFLDWLFWRQ
jgi:C1A family cysteine protease